VCDVRRHAPGGIIVNDYLSTLEAAKSLGVTYNTLISWVYRGKLPTTRRGRWYFVHVDDVEARRRELAA